MRFYCSGVALGMENWKLASYYPYVFIKRTVIQILWMFYLERDWFFVCVAGGMFCLILMSVSHCPTSSDYYYYILRKYTEILEQNCIGYRKSNFWFCISTQFNHFSLLRFYLLSCLSTWQRRDGEREKKVISLFPLMFHSPNACFQALGLGKGQEPRILPQSLTRVAGAHVLEPSLHASQDVLAAARSEVQVPELRSVLLYGLRMTQAAEL